MSKIICSVNVNMSNGQIKYKHKYFIDTNATKSRKEFPGILLNFSPLNMGIEVWNSPFLGFAYSSARVLRMI